MYMWKWKKYKHCCLQTSLSNGDIPIEVFEKLQEREGQRELFGEVRPIIHANFKGRKFVAVENRLYHSSSWKTFPDFLMHYITDVLGREWGNTELKKPFDERHQILKWYVGLCKFQKEQKRGPDGIYSCILNGVTAAYYSLAYDLYILKHHSVLQAEVIRRLRIKEQFQGARYELFAAATCIRAGFDINYEDETDKSKKHPEFIAIHKNTGQKVAVEAKSRHRAGILDFEGEFNPEKENKAGVRRMLKNAFEKTTTFPYVIFVDLNLPPSPEKVLEKPWLKETLNTVERMNRNKEHDCFNLIVFTNHPHHYGNDTEPDPDKDTISVLSNKPKNVPDYPQVILDINKAALQYGNIPNDFPQE